MRQDAFNHKELQALDGQDAKGQSVMFMGASTGCNTVYGSTPPSNPHPYPWMNSLFQDGATISWLMGEALILNHARRSVVPERLCDLLMERNEDLISEEDYFLLARLDDSNMTAQELRELPKVWVIGGDGALGDIGFQNVSKLFSRTDQILTSLCSTRRYTLIRVDRTRIHPPCWRIRHEPIRCSRSR